MKGGKGEGKKITRNTKINQAETKRKDKHIDQRAKRAPGLDYACVTLTRVGAGITSSLGMKTTTELFSQKC